MKKNDIALIRLKNSIEFTMNVRPACLQTDLHDENPNADLTVTGWGLVSTESELKRWMFRRRCIWINKLSIIQ